MSAELDKVKQDKSAHASVPHSNAEGPRRSQRLQTDQSRLHTELERCRAELLARTEGEHGLNTATSVSTTGQCSLLPFDRRGDDVEDAVGSSWFRWNLHQCCWPQAGGGAEGRFRFGFNLVILSPHHECVNSAFFFFLLLELVSAAFGPEETWCGPAVWWTSLLSQHRRREVAPGTDRCRWENSQTGTNTKNAFKVMAESARVKCF